MKLIKKGNILLLVTAAIWGFAFVAQSSAMEHIGPFTFQAVRFLLGATVLLPVILVRSRRGTFAGDKKRMWIGGVLCGITLFIASSFQQMGIALGASTGKAGFITAMYIIIVPILGIFLKKKVGIRIWICALVAVVGLYFLSVKDGFVIEKYDVLLLAGALAFAAQIMLVDYYVPKTDCVGLSAVQFLVTGIMSVVAMLITEHPEMNAIASAWQPVLYGGILSCGVAYTLQVVGQKYTTPGEASIIMSMESPFALLGGMMLLGQIPQYREWIGIGLMFVAIIVSQIKNDNIGDTR